MKRIILLGVVIVLIFAVAYAAQVKCPICNGNSYMTGKSMTDVSGKLLYQYQCMMYQEHKFWKPAN